MRTLIRVRIPVEAGNAAIKAGTLDATIKKFMEAAKPEAAYFLPENGARTMLAVVDLNATSDIPLLTEPLFFGLNAAVDFTPCMNAAELAAGLAKVMASN